MNSNLDTVIKSAVVLILNESIEKERDNYLQVSSYERSTECQDYRNGYYERDFTMSIGKIKLKVPITRNGDFFPSVFEKYDRCNQALVLSMLEVCF
ncbi:transposase [Peribacillus sp. NPDC097284]|uniref:transposase n=1 Tax=Peribacillus sp. NPDC097284 TaxID=3364401 RepID=UPI00382B3141